MAKRSAPDAGSPDLSSDLDPEPVVATRDDSVPRLSADDGQGGSGGPPAELDTSAFQSELTPDPEPEDQATPETDPETAPPVPGAAPSTPPRNTFGGLSPEQIEHYAQLGMQAEAERRATGPYGANYVPATPPRREPVPSQIRQTQQTPAIEPDEPPDPEFDRLARRIRREAGIDEVLEATRRIAAQYEQRGVHEYETDVRSRANRFLDDFCANNPITKDEPEIADEVRELILSRVEGRLQLERTGQVADRIHWESALAADAVQLAKQKAERYARREARRTQQRTEVAGKTRSTAGGITPPPGGAKPKTSADRSRELEANLRKSGWR